MAFQCTPGKDAMLSFISGMFWAILGASVLLAISYIIVPFGQFLMISNYLQVLTAFAGFAVFVTLYFRYGREMGLLYAAGAFVLWGIADIAWYVAVFFGAGSFTFPSLIDMGFVAAILLLSSAYNRIYPRKQGRGMVLLAILVMALLVPLALLATRGINDQVLGILLFFFACGSLIITAVNHSVPDHLMDFTGMVLFALAFLFYPIRESFFANNPYFFVIGTFVSAGFALIVLGALKSVPGSSQPEPVTKDPI